MGAPAFTGYRPKRSFATSSTFVTRARFDLQLLKGRVRSVRCFRVTTAAIDGLVISSSNSADMLGDLEKAREDLKDAHAFIDGAPKGNVEARWVFAIQASDR